MREIDMWPPDEVRLRGRGSAYLARYCETCDRAKLLSIRKKKKYAAIEFKPRNLCEIYDKDSRTWFHFVLYDVLGNRTVSVLAREPAEFYETTALFHNP